MSDKGLISHIKKLNGREFDVIYRLYFKRLCAFASQYVSKSESEEIVQDTMLWLWENRERLSPELSLKSLLFVIVKNKSLNCISHNELTVRIHKDVIERHQQQFHDPDFYLENELLLLFAQAIEKLPTEFRNGFEMNRLEGLTHKEIAKKLCVSPQTINYRICQALKILRSEFKDYFS